jgi:hypothetical protein
MKIKKSKAVLKLERESKEYAIWREKHLAEMKAARKPRKLTPVQEFFI